MEFCIPVHTEDLELKKPDRFYIQTVVEIDSGTDVDGIIEGINDSLLNNSDIVEAVLSHDVYDNIYGLIKAWTILGSSQKTRILEILCSAVQDLLGALGAAPVKAVFADPGDAKRLAGRQRNAFKALVYIFAIAVQVAEKTGAPVSIMKAAPGGRKGGKAGKGRGKKASAAAAAASMDDDEDEAAEGEGGEGAENGAGDAGDAFDWAAYRENALLLLAQAAIETDFRRLWPQGVPEEEFVAVFTKTGLRLLNSPLSMKDKPTRNATVTLIGAATARFPALITSTTVGLVSALTTHDHAASVAADIVVLWGSSSSSADAQDVNTAADAQSVAAEEEGRRPLCAGAASDLLRELGRMGGGGGGADNNSSTGGIPRDSAGMRRAASFIVEVSDRLPSLVLSNVSVLLPFLEADAYTLRSALVTALGNIVGRVFNASRMGVTASTGGDNTTASAAAAAAANNTSVMSEKTRDALLDTLLARAMDVHSLTRAAVLKAWVALVEAGAVPPERLADVARLAVGRVCDKGAMVRRAACTLLRALLEYNPFGGRTEAAWFEAQVAAAEAWLGTNAPALLLRMRGGGGQQAAQSAAPRRGLRAVPEEGAAADDADEAADGDEEADEAVMRESAAALKTEEETGASPPSSSPAEDVLATPEMAAYVRHIEVCTTGRDFAIAISAAVPVVAGLLASKTGSDVKEAIRTLSRARSFGVPGAGAALARMLTLVWSGETGVKEEVIDTFDKLYLLNETLEEEEGEADAEADGDATAAPAAAEPAAAAASASETAAPRPRRAATAKSTKAKTVAARRAKKADEDDDDDEVGELDVNEDDDAEEGDDDEDDEEDEAAGKRGATKRGRNSAKAASATAAGKRRGVSSGGAKKAKSPAAARKGKAAAAAGAATSTSSSSSTSTALSASAAATAASRAHRVDPPLIASNLIGLLRSASLAVRTSLEEVLKEAAVRGLLPVTVLPCLWESVGAGVSAVQKVRVQLALGLAATSKQRNAGTGVLAALSTYRAPLEDALQRSRYAMAILGMVASALPLEVLDTPQGRDRCLKLLQPVKIPGMPLGGAFLATVETLFPPLATVSGGTADADFAVDTAGSSASSTSRLAAFDIGVCSMDYRLARHACVALQRLAPPAQPSLTGAATAAPAPAAAATTVPPPKRVRVAAAAAAVTASAADEGTTRAEQLLSIVFAIGDMVRGDWDGGGDSNLDCEHWYTAAQAGLDAIFVLSPRPDQVCAELLRHMATAAVVVKLPPSSSPPTSTSSAIAAPEGDELQLGIADAGSLSPARLSRLFFVLGHVAMKLLLHTDALATRVKALRTKVAERGAGAVPAAAAAAAPPPADAAAEKQQQKGGKGAKSSGGGAKLSASASSAAAAAAAGGIEDQLGVSGEEEEREAALVTRITEVEINARGLGALLSPLVECLASRHLQHGGVAAVAAASASESSQTDASGAAAAPINGLELLAQSAILALCKLMAVSSSTCEAHLRLVFTVLSTAQSPALRATIAIALGDLAYRFPNLTEPYTLHLYARLRDPSAVVRRNTLMVLSHLILNDMVKVKGQVGEVAVCLHDPDTRIADLTRMFFTELSKRGNNPIYNIFPDTLSCLSKLAAESSRTAAQAVMCGKQGAPLASRVFDGDCFRDVMRFLLGFINKDKHAESLAEKLLHRFETGAVAGTTAGSSSGGAATASDSHSSSSAPLSSGSSASSSDESAASAENDEAQAAHSRRQQQQEAAAAEDEQRCLWRDIAYCLSQLPVSNEKLIRRLAEGVAVYKKCLGDEDTWASFSSILARARKVVGGAATKSTASTSAAAAAGDGSGGGGATTAHSRAELRDVVDAWEKALNEAHAGQAEDDSVANKARAAVRKARRVAAAEGIDAGAIAAAASASALETVAAANAADAAETAGAKKRGGKGSSKAAAAAPAKSSATTAKPRSASGGRKAGTKNRRKRDDSDDEEEEDEEGEAELLSSSSAAAAAPSVLAPPPKKRGLKAAAADDDDDEDDEVVAKKRSVTAAAGKKTTGAAAPTAAGKKGKK